METSFLNTAAVNIKNKFKIATLRGDMNDFFEKFNTYFIDIKYNWDLSESIGMSFLSN